MRIAIIGAGFTGLSAAYTLLKKGHSVTIFEKSSLPGGLAIGYKEEEWNWTLEEHYHHWFTNDNSILSLAKEIGHKVIIRRPHTNWFINKKIYEFDSPKAALIFPLLNPIDKIRNLATLGFLRLDPLWKPLEKVNAVKVLPHLMGRNAYKMLWEPLFINKFGNHAQNVSLAWFWARIKKRTQSLAYPEGGFLTFANHLVEEIEKMGGKVIFNAEIEKIIDETVVKIKTPNQTQEFDKAIVTLPSFLFVKIATNLPQSYINHLAKLQGIGAMNMVLRLSKPFFPDNTYWLSIADKAAPITAIVEHTNFMDKSHYNNEYLIYVGKYLSSQNKQYEMEDSQLLDLFDPYLKTINEKYRNNLIGYRVFRTPFAQPIVPKNYSKLIPPFTTPLPNVYLANIEQVYPWDRGTNYAVELGNKVANLIG